MKELSQGISTDRKVNTSGDLYHLIGFIVKHIVKEYVQLRREGADSVATMCQLQSTCAKYETLKIKSLIETVLDYLANKIIYIHWRCLREY